MKIAMLGYGKMGRVIEQLAQQNGHEFTLKINEDNLEDLTPAALQGIDVAIEFSRPEAAVTNIITCLNNGIPVVSGTTGWLDRYEEIKALCLKNNGAFFYSSNYSIGVYLFNTISQQLATMMNKQSAYNVQMEEIHHTQKLDAPSGTAITLAENILNRLDRKTNWSNDFSDHPATLPIISKRMDEVPGTHTIEWQSEVDTIRLEHIAHSRRGFATGALTAAEWIVGKKGIFGMKDLLGF